MKNWQKSYTRNKPALFIILAIAVVISAVISICAGTVKISPADILAVFFKNSCGIEKQIIMYARLPRTLGCILAGSALAVSGAVIQSVLSNPLAAPNVIGVNSGAGMAVTLCSAFIPGGLAYMPLFAFLGALSGVLLVLLIAEKTSASRITLVLAGVAVSSIFSAVIDGAITFYPDALNGYSDFRIGGFANVPMSRILPAVWVIIPVLIILFSFSNELDILSLGTDTASSLGLKAKTMKFIFLALAAALSGAAVSISGLLGFVGLIVPHIVRSLIGEDSFPLIAGSAMGGAVMLTLCDTLSRTIFSPYELPVGIVLSILGGPFFIWLLIRQRGGRLHG